MNFCARNSANEISARGKLGAGNFANEGLQIKICARFFREIMIVNWRVGPVDGWGTMLNGALLC